VTSAPWTLSFSTEAEGKHVFLAEAVETAGRTATSSATAVTIDGSVVTVTPDVPPAASTSGSPTNETAGVPVTPADERRDSVGSAEAGGCSVSTGGVGCDALATFLIAAVAVQRLMRVRAA
jgi:hypothetical protein